MFFSFILYILACVITVCIATTGCKETLMVDNKDCFDGYKTYLANLGNSGVDSSQILSLLCRNEGRAATDCLKPLLTTCKELADDSMYAVFSVLDAMGGCSPEPIMEDVTLVVENGVQSSACEEAVETCISTEKVGQDIAYAKTQFKKFHEESRAICRKWNCLNHTCQLNITQENIFQQSSFLSFDLRSKFLKFHCEKFPPGFLTDACLGKYLKEDKYIKCYKNATNYAEAKLKCQQYKRAYHCVEDTLKPCKEAHKKEFLQIINFYLSSKFGKHCVIRTETVVTSKEKVESHAHVNMLSLFTLFTTLFVLNPSSIQ